MSDRGALQALAGDQLPASDPRSLVWLSASAGTGKTQVLSARVIRLLLSSDTIRPESILCLTFTKGGASEMAKRINETLARWVMAPGTEVAKDLMALGERCDPDTVARARRLFARVLDARGGGLRIQTIHGFCQSLLGSFPAEAGLPPGFSLIDPREEAALPRQLLARMATESEATGRLGFLDRLEQLGYRLHEDALISYLKRCANAPDMMAQLPPYDGLRAMLRRRLCKGVEDVESRLEELCTDPLPIRLQLDSFAELNQSWKSKKGPENAERIHDWLAGDARHRVDTLKALRTAWLTAEGKLKKQPDKPEFNSLREELEQVFRPLVDLQLAARTADHLALMLSVGSEFAAAYQEEKHIRGLVDFDDLIRITSAMLKTPGIGDWIRYKLDQATDHILIDEAQDTNQRQWDIIKSVADDFFSGSGARGDAHRTLFTVGDYKQAIFRFQGTDPRHFAEAQRYFAAAARGVGRELLDLSLSRSFRSSPPILRVVDAVIDHIGAEAIGLESRPEPHVSHRQDGGAVILMKPVMTEQADDVADEGAEEEGEEGAATAVELILARRIAEMVKGWIDDGLWLDKKQGPIAAGDVMILLRHRSALAPLIVARLLEAGVPVAGVDRLRLTVPLAVKDLLACLRFALQPLDDLNLAALLVSPLIGWSQTKLFEVAHGRGSHSLWQHLKSKVDNHALAPLRAILDMADLETPYQFLETLLSGPFQGRRKLLAQLGEQARDPIDELLNAAFEFARNHPPSLQPFLDWFDRGDIEIKRESAIDAGQARVMTVHGAKGLQAPVVILADATFNPKQQRGQTIVEWDPGNDHPVPIIVPRKDERTPDLSDVINVDRASDEREHWRLLYVALTRAEERLVVTGALRPATKGQIPEGSWYQAVDSAMTRLGITASEDDSKQLIVTASPKPKPALPRPPGAAMPSPLPGPDVRPAVPDWLDRPTPPEARPPRPLAPSALAVDDVADPPPSPALVAAAERGRQLHALFERLPAVPLAHRRDAAERWLGEAAGVADASARQERIDTVISVMDDPRFAPLFVETGLAEAPIAGVVDGVVVAGTVDRLIIGEDAVLVIDFKTGRRVPARPEDIPLPHLRQMAAYHALLASIFPDRPVSAALLYTSGPVLHRLDDGLLAPHKPGLGGQ